MASETNIIIHFLPSHLDKFEGILDDYADSSIYPGLKTGSVVTDPDGYFTSLKGLPFFGMHGSRVGLTARQFCCKGAGDIYFHDCDEIGNLSLQGTDARNGAVPSLVIDSSTLRFTLVNAHVVGVVLDLAAEEMNAKLKELEERGATDADKAAQLEGTPTEKKLR